MSHRQALIARYGAMARRKDCAEFLRAPLANHPRAQRFARSTAQKRLICANRRAGKTSTVGVDSAAELVENNNYLVWVLCKDLSEYGRNWMDRKGHGLIDMLQDGGLSKGTRRDVDAGKADFCTYRNQQGFTRRVEFAWGSTLEVFSDPTAMRGTAPDRFDIDEAQHTHDAASALMSEIGPAFQEKGTKITMSGTPGHEIDTMFGRAVHAAPPEFDSELSEEVRELLSRPWERHVWFSWHNSRWGDSWRERYERHVLGTVALFGSDYGVTSEQMEYLHAIDETTVYQVADHPVGKTLHEDIQRELFGLWVRRVSLFVCAVPRADDPYWDTAATEITRAARGAGLYEDMETEPECWRERIDRLAAFTGEKYGWRAKIGADLGFADPFALVCSVSRPGDETLYELGSSKAAQLGDDHQLALLLLWVEWCERLRLPIDVITMDTGGGGSRSMADSWDRKCRERFGLAVFPAQKWSGSIEETYKYVNMDILAGRKKYLRGSPLAVEAEHLQWKYPDPGKQGKRRPHSEREVVFHDGSKGTPGDHCMDADRYSWFWQPMKTGQAPRPREKLDPMAALEKHILKGMSR